MDTGTARRVVWAGTVASFLLVAGFGNQWVWEHLLEQEDVGENSGYHILGWLNVPHFVLDKSGPFEGLEGKFVAGYLIGAAILVVTVGAVLALARSSAASPFVIGWFSLVAGGAVCVLTSYLITGGFGVTGHFGDDDERTLSAALNALAAGGGYGLLAGWFVGLVCALAAAAGRTPAAHAAAGPPPSSPPPPPAAPPSYPPSDYRY
ncbi:hypothetical protein [Yinghuangia soli]|uniref:Uncharacterized protein n=1 Tax=Yinghuangia soli TaxID=2908204 RepID=A0AA41Q523_9ACTN|nr:hypothetical protein [Yinghuangia soli]MCF2531683.1 hypothetical protein [Yinghuangia soli]